MTKSFDALKVDAEALYQKIRDEGHDSAVLIIVEAFIGLTHEAGVAAIESLENRLLHKEHH